MSIPDANLTVKSHNVRKLMPPIPALPKQAASILNYLATEATASPAIRVGSTNNLE